MILINDLERKHFRYATLLLGAVHTDAVSFDLSGTNPSTTRLTELWSYDTVRVHEALVHGGQGPDDDYHLRKAFRSIFGNLPYDYGKDRPNDGYNCVPGVEMAVSMNWWTLQATGSDLIRIWDNLFVQVKEGPQGGDDDYFDYWPSAWGLMQHMFHDLFDLGIYYDNLATLLAWDRLDETRFMADEKSVDKPQLISR